MKFLKNPFLSLCIFFLQKTRFDAKNGLGEKLFLHVSSLTPIVNVDILVRNPSTAEILLTWRDDNFYRGWHIPGGIIRFKEKMIDRIELVAKVELGAKIDSINGPLVVHELMNNTRDRRGHFISLLFEVKLKDSQVLIPLCSNITCPKIGEYSWFSNPPVDLIPQHARYIPYFKPSL